MDCKDKLAFFRIKELKDVLTELGLPKQGKKQDLVDRILAILSDEQVSKMWTKKSAVGKEEVAKVVDDTYRKMQVSVATDLASKGRSISDIPNAKIKEEMDNLCNSDLKVRCLCGSSLEGSTIKCEDPRCHVWQHISCVIIQEKPMEGNLQPQIPDLFYCEICRLSRADPFWVAVAHPLYPVKLVTTNIPPDGSNPVQGIEKTFHLTRADRDLLTNQEYDVQAWCMLLNDKVQFRMQWPQQADLQVNGVLVRAINRPGSQLLGANGRDDGPIITQCIKDGINKISLTGCDTRIFCVGVRIVKRRTVQQILDMIPKVSDGERFEDALARVCRCVGGGSAADNADSDSDLEVVADSFLVNIRCPMSGSRIKVAGRFKPCAHMGCFDLKVFVEMNQRSKKWQCPICLKNYSLEHIIIDPYFNSITTKMWHSEDITEIEVRPDGSWRVKTKTEVERREIGELAQWHYPDGTLCLPNGEVEVKAEITKDIKQEGFSEGHTGTGLKIGIRKRNGCWEVSKPAEMDTSSSGNGLLGRFQNPEQKVIPMSSSATASGRDGEDPSVNQIGGGNFDFMKNGNEFDSLSLNIDSTYGFANHNVSAPVGGAEVIVLSDSDDDNGILISSETIYENNHTGDVEATFSVPPSEIVDHYPEVPTLGTGGDSYLGSLSNATVDQFEMPPWQLPPGTQAGLGFQPFSSYSFADFQHGPSNGHTPMNDFSLAPETVVGSASLVPDSSVSRSDSLVDIPLAFSGQDPSLQIFLPTGPSDTLVHSSLRDQADVSNGARPDDWISLRLGGGAAGSHGESVSANGLNSRQQMPSREGVIDSLADPASLLLGMNDGRSDQSSRQSSDSPLLVPRQRRSVRQRLYLSIDSDSE